MAEGLRSSQPPGAGGSFDAEVLQRFERIVAGVSPVAEQGGGGAGMAGRSASAPFTAPSGVEVVVSHQVGTAPSSMSADVNGYTPPEQVRAAEAAGMAHGPLSTPGSLPMYGGAWIDGQAMARTAEADERGSASGCSTTGAKVGSPPPEVASSIGSGRPSPPSSGDVGAWLAAARPDPSGPEGFGRGPLLDPFSGSMESQALKPSADTGATIAVAFPTAFTLFCLSAFLVPIWTCVHLSNDANVRYWLGGRFLAAAAWLPILYIVSHVAHTFRGAPVKAAVMASICGSCLFLALAGQLTLRDADAISADLTVQECWSSTRKSALQAQWQEADAFFNQCAAMWASAHFVSMEDAKGRIRITDCPGYAEEAAKEVRGGTWSYLEFLEDRYHCSGWCQEAPSMWTSGITRDACSAAVALVLQSNVRWTAVQVVFYSVTVFVLASISIFTALPVLKRLTAGGAAAGW